MQKARALALLLVSIGCISPAQSQGMMEGTFVRGLGAGMGAGLAGSMGKGKVVRRTYESMLQAQQVMVAQTKQIEQYVATGVQLEAKKQWANAEQYFQDALKMIAKRDGPGSQKSAPVLAHLAKVTKNQNKLDEAIGYQKTVVAFANVAKAQNPAAAVQAQTDLGSMYIDKGQYANAEGVLKQSADIVRHDRSVSSKTYSTTLRVYGEVLRKLNKDAEADSIDAELASQAETNATTATAPGAPTGGATTANPAQVTSAVSVASPAVPVESAPVSASMPVSATSPAALSSGTAASSATDPATSITTGEPKTSASAAQPEAPVASTAPAAQPDAAPPNPPGALLPPPTADWPVMDSDGKIVSQPSAPPVETPVVSPASDAPSASPAASQAVSNTPPPSSNPSSSDSPTAPTQSVSDPASNAPAEAAGSEKTVSK
ncbi:MAG: hypothetical protein C0469_11495 [Cyanobacteria bacterium DS2.3.42]|nr:hypothetical protein [Cyanobacteria bacterium DS2.3.42]